LSWRLGQLRADFGPAGEHVAQRKIGHDGANYLV
jgi:hypothetical protein